MIANHLKIFFISAGDSFHGNSPEERALGGSETALVQVARSLAGMGHAVSVFCPCPAPGIYHQVTYRDHSDLVKASLEESCDVLVVSRFFPAFDLPLKAGLRVLWNHDILDRPEELASRLAKIDLLFVLSRFHRDDYLAKVPECSPKLAITRNGLDLSLLLAAQNAAKRSPGRLVYASRPERGLKLLLDYIWPRLHKTLPGLELTICGYQSTQSGALPAHLAEYRAIDRLLKTTTGIRLMGAMAKEDYYRHLASCDAMIYPCVFPEISCIAALEAQALGTPVITSDHFALSDTVHTPEFKVGGKPGSTAYLETFTTRCLQLLADRDGSLSLAAKAREAVLESHGWDRIALEWETLFLAKLSDNLEIKRESLAASLALGGSRLEALRLLGRKPGACREKPGTSDPDSAGLRVAIEQMLDNVPQSNVSAVACLTPDGLQESPVYPEIDGFFPEPWRLGHERYDLVMLVDHLENQQYPGKLADDILRSLRPGGFLAICTASGAWPLVSPGKACRMHDLGLEQLIQIMGANPVYSRYLPRGLVQCGPESYSAGRWLALFAAGDCKADKDWAGEAWRRTRPAPPELSREVRHAGLL